MKITVNQLKKLIKEEVSNMSKIEQRKSDIVNIASELYNVDPSQITVKVSDTSPRCWATIAVDDDSILHDEKSTRKFGKTVDEALLDLLLDLQSRLEEVNEDLGR